MKEIKIKVKKEILIMRNEAMDFSNKGRSYIEQGNYNDAISTLAKALEIEPDLFEAWFRMGVAYFQKQDYENAAICHLRAWEINPDLAAPEYDIIGCYNKLVERNSKDFNAWSKIGNFFFKKGVFDKAVECYDRTLDARNLPRGDISLCRIHINKGLAHTYLGELEFAIKCYDRALEINSNDKIAQENKMSLLNDITKKKKCSTCGAPLELKVGQLLGKRHYVIVDTDHLRFLMKSVERTIDTKNSRKWDKFKKIEQNYIKIMDEL